MDESVPRRAWLAVGAVALLLLVVVTSTTATAFDVPPLVAFAAASAQCAALPLALIRPWPATAVQFAGASVLALAASWPLPAPVTAVLIAHIGLIGLRTGWRAAVATWWCSVLLCIVLVLLDPNDRSGDDTAENQIIYALISVLILFAAVVVRQRGTVRRELAKARRDVELEQAQRALVEERNRIARELHDVVAHGMSVIHMQATSAAYRIPNMDPESRTEFDRIAAGTKTTLREMRQLLSVLREEDAGRQLAPMPDLGHLGELVESAKNGGVEVDLRVGPVGQLPEALELTVFRLVQESLSNVVRHAPGARVRVDVATADGELHVEVVNEPPTRPPAPMEDANRVKHGLLGMRERVRSAGGQLTTGYRPDGGYRVEALFPLEQK
ncbi:sensor histidine kinase [Cryptosporangium sp. NPDC048952]|uniref:sensor histidine kinase n=1 Tax=Cryptosporangium sp. NPDC048952 TaxID=3363961 RepID=UPI003721DB47